MAIKEWYENDSLWTDLQAVIFTAERLRQAEEEIEQLLKLVGPPPGCAVLDLGCGIGRHSLEFAQRGYRVTGVDRTAAYLERARKTAAERNANVEWYLADMRRFRRDAAFDLAVSLLTSFGYFADPTDDRRVLGHVIASLKPGGTFVLDIMSKEVLARIFRPRDWHEEPGGVILLEERRVTEDWRSLDSRWVVFQDDTRREHRFSLRLYSASELATMLSDVGFTQVRAYGNLSGAPYDHEAQRLVLVARKTASVAEG